ncbi:MAG TPA: hypothetical protein VK395_30825 [Gemmataceae bacterium]|nr:hypothetical protein [Gemmataceae bacterium]
MSQNSSGWSGKDLTQTSIRRFRDFDVSWAGPGRKTGELCFGSEDGRILLTNEELIPTGRFKDSPIPSNEAINGIAFLNDLIALSTRCEVVFVSQQSVNGKGFRSIFPAGAHGVIATLSGYCVAPLGRSGVMMVKPSAGEQQPVTIRRVPNERFDFYKVINISSPGGELLVCATRINGVAAMPFPSEGAGFVSSLTYPGLDVVDVCSLGQNLQAPAIAAVSSDCTLILSRDAFHDPKPTTIKYDEIKGTAYRVFNYDGNLILLTSRAIYVLAALGRRFLANEPIGSRPTPVKAVLLETVDANLVDNRWLLVVMADGVSLLNLEGLVGSVPSAQHADVPQDVSPVESWPDWQPHRTGLESVSREMAHAGR